MASKRHVLEEPPETVVSVSLLRKKYELTLPRFFYAWVFLFGSKY
ncbi:hypothetical protein [Evansella clarkii]|nr:hypothetical protein [Evansella clarkii]